MDKSLMKEELVMKNKSFYRILSDIDNDFLVTSQPLMVNCTGHTLYEEEVKACSIRRDYYLIYLYGGVVDIQAPRQPRNLSAGDLIVFQPGTPFRYQKQLGVLMEYYWIHFSGSWAGELLRQCGISPGQIYTPGVQERLCERFRQIFESFLNRDSFFEIDAAHKLQALLMDLGRCIRSQAAGEQQNDSKISRSLSYIHDHLSSPISVEQLSKLEHMSASHFRWVFRQKTGLSPQDYIALAKLNHACELLRQTDWPIREISAAVGYEDALYFSRVFKKRFGIPPGNYRRRMEEDLPVQNRGLG